MSHVISEASPLEHWADPSGILLDADSEIVVVVRTSPGDMTMPFLDRNRY